MNSVKCNFIVLKNEMESYVGIGGRGLKNLTYPYMGVEEDNNCQNHPYVINEWTLTRSNALRARSVLSQGDCQYSARRSR